MNDNQADRPSISETAKRHISDLIERGKFEYRIFEVVDTLDANVFDIENIRRSIFEIIEINERERLRQSHEIHSTGQGILKLKHPCTAAVFQTWVKCLYAAEPDRKTMRAVFANFISLVRTLSMELDKRFLKLIPEFVKQHKGTAFQIVPIAFDNLCKLDSTEQGLQYLDFLEKYLSTVSEKGLKGLLSLGLALFRLADTRVLEEFEKKCSPKVLKDDEHAEQFIVKCGAAIHRIPKEIQNKYLALCMTATPQSFGSALFIASDLPKKLEQLEGNVKDHYIDSFTQIVSKVGICAVGFCSGRLHKLFSTCPLGEVQKLVKVVCEIASKYGSVAAFDFIEKEEPPSKRSWKIRRNPPVSMRMLVCLILLSVLFLLVFIIMEKL